MTKPIKVGLIDDHNLVRLGLKAILQENPCIKIVFDTGTAAEALQQVTIHSPDIILLDYYLPEYSGLALLQKIHAKAPQAKVIFLTISRNLSLLTRLVRSTASGVMTKDSEFSYIEAIKSVYQGKSYIQPDLAVLLHKKFRDSPVISLSDKEYEVLILYAQGYTMEHIGTNLGITTRTVSNLKFKALKKLGTRDLSTLHKRLFGNTQ